MDDVRESLHTEVGGDAPGRDGRELLVAARSDPEAFAAFYRANVEAILGFFYRRTGCVQTSADLTAETFAQTLASLHRYTPTEAPASAWLFGIARNQLRYFLRKRRVDQRARRKLGMHTEVVVEPRELEEVERRFDTELVMHDLEDAWSTLSRSVAEAVRLRVVEELPYRAIAEELGCTEGAARVRVARGLSQLAESMGAA